MVLSTSLPKKRYCVRKGKEVDLHVWSRNPHSQLLSSNPCSLWSWELAFCKETICRAINYLQSCCEPNAFLISNQLVKQSECSANQLQCHWSYWHFKGGLLFQANWGLTLCSPIFFPDWMNPCKEINQHGPVQGTQKVFPCNAYYYYYYCCCFLLLLF